MIKFVELVIPNTYKYGYAFIMDRVRHAVGIHYWDRRIGNIDLHKDNSILESKVFYLDSSKDKSRCIYAAVHADRVRLRINEVLITYDKIKQVISRISSDVGNGFVVPPVEYPHAACCGVNEREH